MTECLNCAAGRFNPNLNATVCSLCTPGRFSGEKAEVCPPCAAGTVTDQEGTPACQTCPVNSKSDFTKTMCLCDADFYQPYYKPHSNVFICEPCPIGADCSEPGNAWYNLKAQSGWWRANNHTLNFYECYIRSYCPGGLASAQSFPGSDLIDHNDTAEGRLTIYTRDQEHDFADAMSTGCLFKDSSSPCAPFRCGIMCAYPVPGYRVDVGGTMSECPTGALSWVVLVLIAIVVVLAVLLQFYIILRADRDLLANLGDGGMGATDISEMFEESESELESGSKDISESGPGSGSESGSGSSSGSGSGSGSEDESDEDSELQSEAGTDASGTDDDGTTSDGGKNRPAEAVAAVDEPENDPLLKLHEPAPPRSDFTYTLKIFLGFLQIVTSVSSGLDMQWPSTYKTFMGYFGVVNIDALLGAVTSSDCIGNVTYYERYLFITIAPIAAFVAVMIFYKIPFYFDIACFRHSSQQEKTRAKMKFWKLFLYILFLIYPGVSSTILRLYICKDIDGQGYLLTDTRVQCYTDTWNLFTVASIPLILLYPVGVPAFFYTLLRTNKASLHEKNIQAQLGFLYAGYTSQCWWFELCDTFHKLFVTSVLAFFPKEAQLPIGMSAVVVYLMFILALSPYLRHADDLLHTIVQTEILLILLVGYVFQSLPSGSAYSSFEDVLISLALILITGLVFFGFFAFLGRILYNYLSTMYEKYVAKKAKLAAREDAKAAKLAGKSMAVDELTQWVGGWGGWINERFIHTNNESGTCRSSIALQELPARVQRTGLKESMNSTTLNSIARTFCD
jgi:hypothetical protein